MWAALGALDRTGRLEDTDLSAVGGAGTRWEVAACSNNPIVIKWEEQAANLVSEEMLPSPESLSLVLCPAYGEGFYEHICSFHLSYLGSLKLAKLWSFFHLRAVTLTGPLPQCSSHDTHVIMPFIFFF